MAATKSRAEAMASVQAVIDRYHMLAKKLNFQGFDYKLMDEIRLIDADPSGSVVYEVVITDAYANLNGVMHGGAAGVIFDICTTTALGPIARPGFWEYACLVEHTIHLTDKADGHSFLAGVSRTLNISYLRAIPIGTVVHVVAQVVQHGRTMAMIRGAIVSQDGKTTYAACEHHKVNVPTKETHMVAEVLREGCRQSKL